MNKEFVVPSAEELARLRTVQRLVVKYNEQYYKAAHSEVSDATYDALRAELEEYEKKWPQYGLLYGVGDDRTAGFRKVQHLTPMLSLDNTYTFQEVETFVERVERNLGYAPSYAVELKFDGVAISLHYARGEFVQAVTRGNGIEGDDVTRNVRQLHNVPLRLQSGEWPATLEVRGEVYMPRSVLQRINAERKAQGENPFENARNAAAGSLKLRLTQVKEEHVSRELQRVWEELQRRGLLCTLYYMREGERVTEQHVHALQLMQAWGLPVNEYVEVCRTPTEIYKVIEHFAQLRKTLDFDTDGVVVKVNEYAAQQTLGNSARAPRWAMAYKYDTERGVTRLEGVQFQVGRTGTVTPVALLEGVRVGGVTIQRATLHNADQLAALDLHYGDVVEVQRAGEVIPQIVQVDKKQRKEQAKRVSYPTHCPACGTPLAKEDGEARWYCPNRLGCAAQIVASISYFASKSAVDIAGLGEGKVKRLVQEGILHNLWDLYTLDYDRLAQLEGFSHDGAQTLREAIEASKTQPAYRVLCGLGIHGVGEVMARNLVNHFGSVAALAQASVEELSGVEGVGHILSHELWAFFHSPANEGLVERLHTLGFTLPVEVATTTSEGALAGERVVITGKVEGYGRTEAQALVKQLGGEVQSSVSATTTLLVVGEKPGESKLKAAQARGVRIMEARNLLQLLGSK